jgi:hypothetical protein
MAMRAPAIILAIHPGAAPMLKLLAPVGVANGSLGLQRQAAVGTGIRESPCMAAQQGCLLMAKFTFFSATNENKLICRLAHQKSDHSINRVEFKRQDHLKQSKANIQ